MAALAIPQERQHRALGTGARRRFVPAPISACLATPARGRGWRPWRARNGPLAALPGAPRARGADLSLITWAPRGPPMGLLDRLRGEGGEAVEAAAPDPAEEATAGQPAPEMPPAPETPREEAAGAGLGISELMGRRAGLEEAVDHVGVMIKGLKDKRTVLEKEIEEESVEVKNLREKLVKIQEYIEEERRGLDALKKRRAAVEAAAVEAAERMAALRAMISELDGIVNAESARTRAFRESGRAMDGAGTG